MYLFYFDNLGTQTTVIVCVKGDSQAIVTDQNCDNALKPAEQTITCNNNACPPKWVHHFFYLTNNQCFPLVFYHGHIIKIYWICYSLPFAILTFSWEPSEWSRCSTSCDPGTKTREISCKQRVSNSLILDVRDSLCRNLPKQATVATCNNDRPCVRWRIGNWSQVKAEIKYRHQKVILFFKKSYQAMLIFYRSFPIKFSREDKIHNC